MAVMNVADKLTAIEQLKLSENPNPFIIMDYAKEENTLLKDIPFARCNKGTEHVLPAELVGERPIGAAVAYNEGAPNVSVRTEVRVERTVRVKQFSEVDRDQATDSGNPDKLRSCQAQAIITGMAQSQARKWIYGKPKGATLNTNEIYGLATRLNKLDGKQCLSAKASPTTGDVPRTSLFICAIGENYLYGIYPQYAENGKEDEIVGIYHKDHGEQLVEKSGGKVAMLVDEFMIRQGIALQNPRSVIRIANITADFTKENRAAFIDTVLSAIRRMPGGAPTYAVYGNFMALDILDKAARETDTVIRESEDPWGKEVSLIRGFRIRPMQAISEEEAVVTAA